MRLRRLPRFLLSHVRLIVLITFLTFLEIYLHVQSFSVPHPSEPLDPPFAHACRPSSDPSHIFNPRSNAAPPDAAEPRENATIIMLARNSDREGAVHAVRSLEKQWNRHFHYPYVFLNNKPFDAAFKAGLAAEVSGPATFDTIPAHMWSWPKDPTTGRETPDRATAQKAMQRMEARGMPYAGNENYHHMCRFYSGFFFDHPSLLQYEWYWRLEPDVEYTCAIPYDPFRQMRLAGKVYGYVMALWEVGSTSPSLFRTAINHMRSFNIDGGLGWQSLIAPSTAPWPFRKLLMPRSSIFHSRTPGGDAWNFCHFWSNFEIASLSFYRSKEYRDFFRTLDEAGGFYTERWGDAPVHSLAASMFLKPEELHWFADLGYIHPPLRHCPDVEGRGAKGCGCQCAKPLEGMRGVPSDCLESLRRAVEPG
ncbi:MAG: hypothetical protein Q9162_006405 [Coniocarpon cinnabarinum]